MEKTENNKGFTLVELIVVIAILAILGTIAFMSLQGYSADARDAKRSTTISNIRQLVELSLIKGINILTFANGTGAVITSGSGIQISGYYGYDTLSGVYKAGDINYTALGIDEEDVQDPVSGDLYKFGGTTYNKQYNIAASIEDSGEPNSYVVGTWNPRETILFPKDKYDGNVFYLSGITANETGLRKGDHVRMTLTGSYEITKTDGYKIFLDKTITHSGANIFLNLNESRYLIRKRDSAYPINIDAGERYIPYKLNN